MPDQPTRCEAILDRKMSISPNLEMAERLQKVEQVMEFRDDEYRR